MSRLFNYKLIFLAIFLLLIVAIKNCENFQLRDVSTTDSSPGIAKNAGISKTKIRFPFRRLEKFDDDDEDDDENDDDEDDDDDTNDDENSNEKIESDIYKNYKFTKVRKPTLEVKKRENLRFSKLAQFRGKDDMDDESGEDENESSSIFSRILSFFSSSSSKPKEEIEETTDDLDDSKEETESSELNDQEGENENKPLLTQLYDKFKDFLEARNQDRSGLKGSEEDETDDDDDIDKDSNTSSDDDDDDSEQESTLKNTLKSFFHKVFNRMPFNLIFDFDDSDDTDSYVDSEEDDRNYQILLREEREHEKLKTESLLNHISEEEQAPPKADEPEESTNEVEEETEQEEKPVKEESPVPAVKKEPKQKKSKEEVHLAHKEFEKLLLNLPSFVPDYSKVKNPECHRQGEVFQRQLRGQKIWALQMMDANAKIPSGLLRGNVNQLGDFDLCTKISQKIKITESNVMRMKGKYCLANIDVVAAVDQLKLPVHLMQGRNFIRSTINDPSHFFPRYSTINWGLCLPSACTYSDADHILESFIGPYNSTGIKLHISADEDSCYVRKSSQSINIIKDDWKIFGSCLFIFLAISATVLSTLNEYLDTPFMSTLYKSPKPKESEEADGKKMPKSSDTLPCRVLSCFSLKQNLPKLWSDSSDDEIKCLHGLKAVSIVLLFISLRLIPMGRVPYTNRNKFTEFFNSPLTVFLRSSFLYEDTFLVISGMLATLSVLKEISSGGKIVWLKKVFARYLRLMLPLSFVVLFYAYIFEHIGTGPQWNLITKNAELCQDNWWKNLLFVQNFYPFEDMCASHTYHLAVDFQLFILTPLLVWLIYKNPTYGFGLYGILHTLSAGARFSAADDFRLSTVVFHGMKLSQLYRTFNLSFAVAIHRATPYLNGIALGIAVKEFGKVQLPKGVAYSGWVATITGLIWCYYKPSNLSHKDYQYDPISAAQYSALAPLLWSLSISWIIFACHNDASWKLNDIMRSRPMLIISRLSYSVYLIIFIVFFYFSGTLKSSEEFHVLSYLDRMETCLVFIIAFLFTLVVDIPTQNLVKLILNSNTNVTTAETMHENDDVKSSNDDIDDIFGDREEAEYVFRPVKSKYSYDDNINGDHIKGNGTTKDDEPEAEEVVEAKFELTPKNTMNARRWRREIYDD